MVSTLIYVVIGLLALLSLILMIYRIFFDKHSKAVGNNSKKYLNWFTDISMGFGVTSYFNILLKNNRVKLKYIHVPGAILLDYKILIFSNFLKVKFNKKDLDFKIKENKIWAEKNKKRLSNIVNIESLFRAKALLKKEMKIDIDIIVVTKNIENVLYKKSLTICPIQQIGNLLNTESINVSKEQIDNFTKYMHSKNVLYKDPKKEKNK